jgi:hypothetical protein
MEEHDMAEGGRREEIDAKIAHWERDLERVRVALANATDALNARHHSTFVELYCRKEVAKSRWEAIRGVYRPDSHAVRRCEEGLAAMEAAWQQAHAMLNETLATQSA